MALLLCFLKVYPQRLFYHKDADSPHVNTTKCVGNAHSVTFSREDHETTDHSAFSFLGFLDAV